MNDVRLSVFDRTRAPPPRTIDRNHEVGPAARRRRVRPPGDDRDVSTCSRIYTRRGDIVRGAFERRPPASRKSGSSSIVLFGAVPGVVFRRYGVVLHVESDWWSLRGGDGRMVSGRRVGQCGWWTASIPRLWGCSRGMSTERSDVLTPRLSWSWVGGATPPIRAQPPRAIIHLSAVLRRRLIVQSRPLRTVNVTSQNELILSMPICDCTEPHLIQSSLEARPLATKRVARVSVSGAYGGRVQ